MSQKRTTSRDVVWHESVRLADIMAKEEEEVGHCDKEEKHQADTAYAFKLAENVWKKLAPSALFALSF